MENFLVFGVLRWLKMEGTAVVFSFLSISSPILILISVKMFLRKEKKKQLTAVKINILMAPSESECVNGLTMNSCCSANDNSEHFCLHVQCMRKGECYNSVEETQQESELMNLCEEKHSSSRGIL